MGRWLRHEPVNAAPPGACYRLRKFARRHRVGVASTAAILLLMITGTVVSTWQALRARRAEKQAVIQASKSDTITRFLQEMLQGVGPSVAFGRDPAILVEILDKTAARVDQEHPSRRLTVSATAPGGLRGIALAIGQHVALG